MNAFRPRFSNGAVGLKPMRLVQLLRGVVIEQTPGAFRAFIMYGLGIATPYLRDDLHLTAFEAGLHGSALAVGILIAGVATDRIARLVGMHWLPDLEVRERGCPASPQTRLSLRVLRLLAGSLETVLLALLHSRVAAEEAGLPERKTVALRIDLEEGAGDTMTDGAGLARHAAALDLDLGVVCALGAGDSERHANVGLVDGIAEMRVEAPIVDDDLTRTGHESDTSHRGLAATGPVVEGRGGHHAPRQASGSGR